MRALKKVFGPKREGVTGGWTELLSDEIHDLHSSPTIFKVIKSRRMRGVGRVARVGQTIKNA
jgi:hypothetical protein